MRRKTDLSHLTIGAYYQPIVIYEDTVMIYNDSANLVACDKKYFEFISADKMLYNELRERSRDES